MAKQNIIIDVICTEDSQEIFKVAVFEGECSTSNTPPDSCNGSGLFIDEDELDTYLEENADNLEIVEDYRSK